MTGDLAIPFILRAAVARVTPAGTALRASTTLRIRAATHTGIVLARLLVGAVAGRTAVPGLALTTAALPAVAFAVAGTATTLTHQTGLGSSAIPVPAARGSGPATVVATLGARGTVRLDSAGLATVIDALLVPPTLAILATVAQEALATAAHGVGAALGIFRTSTRRTGAADAGAASAVLADGAIAAHALDAPPGAAALSLGTMRVGLADATFSLVGAALAGAAILGGAAGRLDAVPVATDLPFATLGAGITTAAAGPTAHLSLKA